MARILLTNDDGVRRPGLWLLHHVLWGLGDVVVVAPESMRSATGMSLTLHKPLRIRQLRHQGFKAYSVSGTPSDCVILAVNKIMRERPDILVSGINEGENVSYQAIYGSGTVAAAIRAALLGIPSAAFSLDLPRRRPLDPALLRARMAEAARVAGAIVRYILEEGLPEGVDYLNVNFPEDISASTPIRITRVHTARYREVVDERRDPVNRPYYWIYGELLPGESFRPGTDVYAVFVEKAVSISPMRVDAAADVETYRLNRLVEYLSAGKHV
ncbi:5'-nucleotidase SurE [archaeon HR01]|nr:5'-nucleotidase SurE [archaeon HR01]